MRESLAERYRQRRILLAGGRRAHPQPGGPTGQNVGLQDAHNLAWKLTLVIQGQALRLVSRAPSVRRRLALGDFGTVVAVSRAYGQGDPERSLLGDRHGACHQAFAATGPVLCLIRPR